MQAPQNPYLCVILRMFAVFWPNYNISERNLVIKTLKTNYFSYKL